MKATNTDKDWDVAPFLDVSLQAVEDRTAVSGPPPPQLPHVRLSGVVCDHAAARMTRFAQEALVGGSDLPPALEARGIAPPTHPPQHRTG